MRLLLLFQTIAILSVIPLEAQQYRFKLLSNEDGLPQGVVRSLLQDKDGYMWLGTYAGLARYNGFHLETWGISDGLADDFINEIAQDADGFIWVGTPSGLSKMSNGRFENFRPDVSDPHIVHFVIDDANRFWCAGPSGLIEFSSGGFRLHSGSNGLPLAQVYDVEIGPEGYLWVATENGLYKKIDDQFHHIEAVGVGRTTTLTFAGKSCWVSRENELVELFDGEIRNSFGEDDGITALTSRTILAAADGTIWTDIGDGVIFIEDGRVVKITEDAGLPVNSVEKIYQDRDGLIWIGGTLGAAIFTGRPFTNYGKAHGLAADGIRALLLDDRNHIWVGTLRGLSRFDRQQWHHYGPEDGLQETYISVIRQLPNQRVGFGTRFGGFLIENNQLQEITGLPKGQVNDVQEDDSGTLWVAVRGVGLFNGHLDNFERVFIPNQKYWSGRMLLDREKRLWVSGQKGLSCWNGQSWKTYTTEDGLAGQRPYFIMQDQEGSIWFSYYNSLGVTRFDGRTFKTWSSQDGMANDAVFSIGQDINGRYWFGTAAGVDVFDGEQFRNYSPLEGYGDYESNSGAFVADPDGTIWFGTMGGLSHYNPKSDYTHITIKAPVIQTLSLGGKKVSLDRPIEVKHTDNDLEARLGLLNYLPRQRLSMRYRLSGDNNEWHALEGSLVQVANLAPGSYLLDVQVRKYNEPYAATTSIPFTVTPPFWHTWWFRLCMLVICLLWGFAVYQYKVRSIKHQNIKLEGMVTTRTKALLEETREHAKARQALEDAQKQLLERAHKSGMAEVMSGVLHNIGNVLSSVGTSASVVNSKLEKSKITSLTQVNKILDEHKDNLEHFLTEDPKGQKIVPFLAELETRLLRDHADNIGNMARLIEKIENIKTYIKTHQSHARAGFFSEASDLAEVVEDALMIQSAAFDREGIEVAKEFETVPNIRVQKIKLTQILINLLKNAMEAIVETNSQNRKLWIHLKGGNDYILLSVKDTGCGLDSEQLTKVFNHGYTTKRKGYGFGLHSCANYMTEMGGKMWAESKGKGQGATFILRFPLHKSSVVEAK